MPALRWPTRAAPRSRAGQQPTRVAGQDRCPVEPSLGGFPTMCGSAGGLAGIQTAAPLEEAGSAPSRAERMQDTLKNLWNNHRPATIAAAAGVLAVIVAIAGY